MIDCHGQADGGRRLTPTILFQFTETSSLVLLLPEARKRLMHIIFATFAVACIYTVVVWIIGLFWLLVVLMPYLFVGGVIFYFLTRSSRIKAQTEAGLERDAQRERDLNRKEFEAWRSAVADRERAADRKAKALRKFDRRNPHRDP